MSGLVTNVDRESGLTVHFNATTATSLSLPTGGTPVVVTTIGTAQGAEVDFTYTPGTGIYTAVCAGPVRIDVTTSIAATLAAGAIQQVLIQRQDGAGGFATLSADVRVQSVAGNTQTLATSCRTDHVEAGTQFRIAYVSDTNSDSAEIYSLTVKCLRPAGNRGLSS